MPSTRRMPSVRSFPRSVVAAALAIAAAAPFAPAQLTTQASYPLAVDLLDATATYGPAVLYGTPPPSGPANGVCMNGIYYFSGGQDIRTPVITTLDTNDFQIDVDFEITAMPTAQVGPVLMGGHLWRWLGIYLQQSGIVGIKHNNSNLAWSTTTLATGQWYRGTLKYEQGTAELYINGALVLSQSVGVLSTGNNHNVCTNDYSNGLAFNGCIRNLVVANDTTLGPSAVALPFGTGCDGLTLGANGVPALGNFTFELIVDNLPATAPPLAFVAFGTSAVEPGADLSFLGMQGCFGYTSLDLGLFGPVVAVGTTASFALPIPNDPTLMGASVAAQGVSFSTLTSLGLAASNGLRLVIGL